MKRRTDTGSRAAGLRFGIFSLTLALSTAYAAKPGAANGVDLDIQQFRATTKVDLSSRKGADIRIDLSVRNNGTVDEPRTATLVGRTIPGDNLVFQDQLQVYDPPAGGPTAFVISPTDMGFIPQAGGIRWEIVIPDADPDDDTATDITVVRP
jgi:hypothetical protein